MLTSIGPFVLISRRRALYLVLQIAVGLAIAYFVLSETSRQWSSVRAAAVNLHPHWAWISASCALVLLTYCVLIEVWRRILTGWSAHLSFPAAARIWSVSNLARYLPGSLWQLGAMAVMARRRSVSGVVAAGSALLSTLATTISGLVVVLIAGGQFLPVPRWAGLLVALLSVGLLLAPPVIPRLARLASRLTGRDVDLPRLPTRVLLESVALSAVAWWMFGTAFLVFARGLLGQVPGDWALYLGIFAGSYLAGFLALPVPAGIGVRESVMFAGLTHAGIDSASAILLVGASRLWLTLLEIFPASLFLAHDALQRRALR